MAEYDFAIIGAGAAGEACAFEALRLGASVAIIERELFGGSCPFWACMPSKALLHAAGVHALGGDYAWPRASEFRDYMINRERRDWPDDTGHVNRLRDAGADVIRGAAKVIGPGRVQVNGDDGRREVRGRFLIVAVGTHSAVPDLPGLDSIAGWSNREATSTRDLPRSLLVLGGGPTGVEMAQVMARYGVPVSVVHPTDHLNHRDHPRSSEYVADGLRHDGVTLRLGVRAERIRAGAGDDAAHRFELSDGSHVDAHEVLFAIGRTAPLKDLGLETLGVSVDDEERVQPDDHLRIADDTYVIGDPAGPEMHTHLAHYEGEIVARMALGKDVTPDFRAIPRAIYTDPEAAGVGLLLEQAKAGGLDALELTVDLATSAKGYVSESVGHATIVVDRGSRTLVGTFIAGPGASEAIHMAVLAVKARTPVAVLADTITAFPTTSRALGGLFVEADRALARG
ncbi:MAG TPA: NAD(P)/FAD-dependent oxidoreductase [Candidatus Limnocylindrales bacterium]|nr:NAD(P)/FAD-dependent oxidoreductase [Candidatus Limnocylindrales bacterium]